jgi:hypothetical protein
MGTGTIRHGVFAVLNRGELEDISRAGRGLVRAEFSFDAAGERYRAILTDLPT